MGTVAEVEDTSREVVPVKVAEVKAAMNQANNVIAHQ
jgi:hypothetical protein